MNYEKIVIERLRDYPNKKAAVESLKAQIDLLREQMMNIKNSSAKVPVQGGGSSTEERYISNIARRQLLETRLREAATEVNLMEKGLSGLTDEERDVLEKMVMYRCEAKTTAEKLNYSVSGIYQIRNRALRRLALRLYGAVEA